MKNTKVYLHLALYVFAFCFSLAGHAQSIVAPTKEEPKKDPHQGEAFAAYIENDARVLGGPGSDRAYSNGFKFSYIFAQDESPDWSKRPLHFFELLQRELDHAKSNLAISFAQQIYTPNNTAVATLIPDDRPYAAWMYVGLGFSFKEKYVAHYFELDIVAVGPSALG